MNSEPMSIRHTYSALRPTAFPDARNGLRNPERGLRFEILTGRLPDDLCQFANAENRRWPFARFASDGITITQAYCYLSNFWNSAISQAKLDALQNDFDRARRDGVKFLLRFAYEFDDCTVGPDVDRICSHADQLRPILERNKDVIYVLQIGWVGLWGEFHSSVHGTEHDVKKTARIVRKTLEILPPDRKSMMRRGQYLIRNLNELGATHPVDAGTANTDAPAARLGFFNDGTLANESDGSTFPEKPFLSAPGNPEFDYISRIAPFIPVDGELFWTGQFTSIDAARWDLAIERFRLHHYSTFSYVHGFSGQDKPEYWTIDAWKDQILDPDWLRRNNFPFAPEYFDGAPRSAFEYIRDHLGYRLELSQAEFPDAVSRGSELVIRATLVNRGFAAPVNPRPIRFVLFNESGQTLTLSADTDFRNLQPYEPGDPAFKTIGHELCASSVVPDDLPPGKYALAIWMPDGSESLAFRPDFAVRLASEIPWIERDGRGMHLLGNLSLH